METINPSLYIHDTDPTNEPVMMASRWYATQTCSTDDKERIPWLTAQGWRQTYTSNKGKTTHFERRVLRPEWALNDLIVSYTKAYNEGRQLNDQRYDDIIAIYTALLDKEQTELVSLSSSDDTYEDLVNTIIGNLQPDYDAHKADIDGTFEDYGDSQRDRINRQFDAKVSEFRANLISKGMYNTTVWNTISAGLERERAIALNDIEDKIIIQGISIKDRLFALKVDVKAKIISARDRLRAQLQAQSMDRMNLRGNIMNALMNFMERRTDSYPDMSSIGQIATNLGAGSVSGDAT